MKKLKTIIVVKLRTPVRTNKDLMTIRNIYEAQIKGRLPDAVVLVAGENADITISQVQQ